MCEPAGCCGAGGLLSLFSITHSVGRSLLCSALLCLGTPGLCLCALGLFLRLRASSAGAWAGRGGQADQVPQRPLGLQPRCRAHPGPLDVPHTLVAKLKKLFSQHGSQDRRPGGTEDPRKPWEWCWFLATSHRVPENQGQLHSPAPVKEKLTWTPSCHTTGTCAQRCPVPRPDGDSFPGAEPTSPRHQEAVRGSLLPPRPWRPWLRGAWALLCTSWPGPWTGYPGGQQQAGAWFLPDLPLAERRETAPTISVLWPSSGTPRPRPALACSPPCLSTKASVPGAPRPPAMAGCPFAGAQVTEEQGTPSFPALTSTPLQGRVPAPRGS